MMSARSIKACTVCQSTASNYPFRSCHVSRQAPGFELSGQKIVGHGQLPNLGVQVFHLFFACLGRSFVTNPFKHARRTLQQGFLPGMDHCRVYPKVAGSFRHRARALQSHATFALNSGLWFFHFDISDRLCIEDQKTTNCSLRLCPNFGGEISKKPLV